MPSGQSAGRWCNVRQGRKQQRSPLLTPNHGLLVLLHSPGTAASSWPSNLSAPPHSQLACRLCPAPRLLTCPSSPGPAPCFRHVRLMLQGPYQPSIMDSLSFYSFGLGTETSFWTLTCQLISLLTTVLNLRLLTSALNHAPALRSRHVPLMVQEPRVQGQVRVDMTSSRTVAVAILMTPQSFRLRHVMVQEPRVQGQVRVRKGCRIKSTNSSSCSLQGG